jgi:hypothetical protein
VAERESDRLGIKGEKQKQQVISSGTIKPLSN